MTNADLLGFWATYGALVLLGAGLTGLIALAGFTVWARRSKKPLRPIALAVSMNLALLLNAEGMWVVAIDDLKLPKVFAVLVFAVFEICFLTATSLAAEQYRRTTVLNPDETIKTPGHPGNMLYVAALIAGLSGVIVASNAPSFTEKLLRLAVPAVIFLMWWAALTAAGQKLRRSRFAYSPRRLAERWGWLIPDEDPDLQAMAAARQVRRMVVNHQRVSAGRFPAVWWRSRLQKDARTATDAVVGEVVAQLARIESVMALLAPAGITPGEPERRVAEPVEAPDLSDSLSDNLSVTLRPAPVFVEEDVEGLEDLELPGDLSDSVADTKPLARKRQPSAEDKVIAGHKRTPGASDEALAARLNLSVRTVQRWRPKSAEAAQQVNGREPVLEGADR